MSRVNNEDQFKFLISCIRYANNNKVDFAAVAKECGIVSKGAAAKRYERLMKAHGIATTGPPSSRVTPAPSLTKRENTTKEKKRKLDNFKGDNVNGAVDDDEGVVAVKDEPQGSGFHDAFVKAEEGQVGMTSFGIDVPNFPAASGANVWDLTTGEGGRGDGGSTLDGGDVAAENQPSFNLDHGLNAADHEVALAETTETGSILLSD